MSPKISPRTYWRKLTVNRTPTFSELLDCLEFPTLQNAVKERLRKRKLSVHELLYLAENVPCIQGHAANRLVAMAQHLEIAELWTVFWAVKPARKRIGAQLLAHDLCQGDLWLIFLSVKELQSLAGAQILASSEVTKEERDVVLEKVPSLQLASSA